MLTIRILRILRDPPVLPKHPWCQFQVPWLCRKRVVVPLSFLLSGPTQTGQAFKAGKYSFRGTHYLANIFSACSTNSCSASTRSSPVTLSTRPKALRSIASLRQLPLRCNLAPLPASRDCGSGVRFPEIATIRSRLVARCLHPTQVLTGSIVTAIRRLYQRRPPLVLQDRVWLNVNLGAGEAGG